MTMIGRLMAGVLGVCVASVCYCQEQTDFWKLDYNSQARLSRAAAVANPKIAQQLNADTIRCLRRIQSECAQFAESHPVFRGIDKVEMDMGNVEHAEDVRCVLSFLKNTSLVSAPSGRYVAPGKDGVVIVVAMRDMVSLPCMMGATASYRMLCKGICIEAGYKLELGEKNQNLLRPMRNIVEKRLMEFCNAHADKEIIYYDSDTSRDTTLMKGDATPQH